MMNNSNSPKPTEIPVSLQPFKALKIVFLILSIVFTLFFSIMIADVVVESISYYNVVASGDDPIAGPGYTTSYFIFAIIFVIPFWILFFVFNRKYKERVKYNENQIQ